MYFFYFLNQSCNILYYYSVLIRENILKAEAHTCSTYNHGCYILYTKINLESNDITYYYTNLIVEVFAVSCL